MAREWKAGDVAMYYDDRRVMYVINDDGDAYWIDSDGDMRRGASDRLVRPLVVIDPEDRKQVERFIRALDPVSETILPKRIDYFAAALYGFVNPKPDEPVGLGAVVEDAQGNRYVRTESDAGMSMWVRSQAPEATDPRYVWSELPVVRVLSEGIQ